MRTSYDVIVIGETPTAALFIVAFVARNPGAAVLHLRLRDAPATVGWTRAFDPGDLPSEAARALEPWIEPRHRIVFPNLDRVFARPLAALTPERLNTAWKNAMVVHPDSRAFDVADVVAGERVHVSDGTTFSAPWIIDARTPDAPHGQNVRMQLQSWVLTCEAAPPAVLMAHDASTTDAFTFLRVVPTAADRAVVTRVVLGAETTLPAWDDGRMLAAARRFLHGTPSIIARESGSVPLPVGSRTIDAGPPLRVAAADGWLHPGTGDDTVVVTQLGAALAAADPRDPGVVLRAQALQQTQRSAFPCLMNELVFRATPPASRWMVFQHFMGMEADIVQRYMGLADTSSDRKRIVFRRPPPGVHLLKAAAILSRYGLRG
jgi:hypothetical protein